MGVVSSPMDFDCTSRARSEVGVRPPGSVTGGESLDVGDRVRRPSEGIEVLRHQATPGIGDPEGELNVGGGGVVTEWNRASEKLSGIAARRAVGRELAAIGWHGDLDIKIAQRVCTEQRGGESRGDKQSEKCQGSHGFG